MVTENTTAAYVHRGATPAADAPGVRVSLCETRAAAPFGALAAMTVELDLQNVSDSTLVPSASALKCWTAEILSGGHERAELTIRVVDETESAELNQRFRGKTGPTNVLSFPFEAPPGMPHTDLIGDLVICAPVVERESREQGKALDAHWAHMVVHGVLHLLGYDHLEGDQAAEMEDLETLILTGLGFPPPYEEPSSFQ